MRNGSTEKTYLDIDVLLAEFERDDWLSSAVEIDSLGESKTSVASGIELQYAMEDEWDRDRLAAAHRIVAETGVELVPLTTDQMHAAETVRTRCHAVNVFDAVHLGTAMTLSEPIVSTDTLYPQISEVEHVDPRDLST